MNEQDFTQLHSMEAEQSILGGLMLDNNAWDKISDLIEHKMFFDRANQIIAEHLFKCLDDGKPCDFVTIAGVLKDHGKLQDVGDMAYLIAITQNTPSSANIRRYADMVATKYVARQAIHITGEMVESLQEPKGKKASDIVSDSIANLELLTQEKNSNDNVTDATSLALKIIHAIDYNYSQPEGYIDGTPTGYRDLDEVLMGMKGGDLVIIAGRPGMGKTVMMMDMAMHAGRTTGPAFVFSMEMSQVQLGYRMAASLSSVDLKRIQSGRLEDGDWDLLPNFARICNDELKMHIDYRAALKVGQIRTRCRQWKRKYGKPSGIYVDYIQLMQGDGENRTQEIGSITGGLKQLAKEFDCPVIALSQLSRAVEQRADKRPMMSDLRESGNIEQDADIILFPYRDERYNPDSQYRGMAEIVFGKFRQGDGKNVFLEWQGQYSRMRDLQPGYLPPEREEPKKPQRRGGFDA